MSSSDLIMSSSPSSLISVPAYDAKMTSSPFLTFQAARSPESRRLPSPRARILPRLGFSLAVSGRTIPDLVLDSASTRLTRILSPRGRSLGIAILLCEIVTCSLLLVTCSGGPARFVITAQNAGQGVEQE